MGRHMQACLLGGDVLRGVAWFLVKALKAQIYECVTHTDKTWKKPRLKLASSAGQYQIKIGGEVDWPLTSTVQRILGTAVGM